MCVDSKFVETNDSVRFIYFKYMKLQVITKMSDDQWHFSKALKSTELN